MIVRLEKLVDARGNLQSCVVEMRVEEEILRNFEKWLTDAKNAIEEAGKLMGSFGYRRPAKAGIENEGKSDLAQISYHADLQHMVSSSSVNCFEALTYFT